MKKFLLQILNSPYIGGVEIYTENLDEQLEIKGISTYLLCNLQQLIKKVREKGTKSYYYFGIKAGGVKKILAFIILSPIITVYYFFPLLYFRYVKRINNLHLQDVTEKIILSPLGKFLGFNIIWTEHGTLSEWLKNQFILSQVKKASSYADHIVAVSQVAADDLINNVGIDSKKIKVIYSGVDLEKNNQLKEKAPLETKFRVLYLGRMTSDKKIDQFIGKIPKDFSDIEFHFVGTGDLLPDLLERYRNQKNLFFDGYQEDITTPISQCDIGISPSLHPSEGVPLAIMEEMSLGKPVIAFDVGGISEIISDKENGILIPSGDFNLFMEKIRLLEKDHETRKKLSKKAIETVKLKFNLPKNVDSFERLLI